MEFMCQIKPLQKKSGWIHNLWMAGGMVWQKYSCKDTAQRQLQPPFGKLPFANGMFANGAF